MSPAVARPAILALVCSSLALGACADRQDDTLLAPQFAGVGVSRMPFGGDCRTEFTMTSQTQTGATMVITGTCQLRGIGRVSMLANQTLTFTQAGIEMSNSGTYTTPAGHEIHASFTGTGFPDPSAPATAVIFSGVETYAGGTGRFTDIAGSAQMTGGASLATGTGHFTSRGTITF